MTWGLLLQAVVSGLLLGGVYGLVACGLSLVFGVLRIINFAHGAVMMLAMYAMPALIQVQNGKPVVVGPAKYAEAKPIFPVLKWKG